MKEFSIFQYALDGMGGNVLEDLGAVPNISRRFYDEHETFTFRSQVPCLEYASLLIENGLLLRTHRGGRVYAGFEKLSRMQAVVDRYLRIADVSERVYVFGEDDWQPPRHPNLRAFTLAPSSPLAREWFVIADSPSLRVALVATDEDRDARPNDNRNFRAFRTSDPALVARLAAAAEGLVDDALAA